MPWGEEAGELLDELLIERLPHEVTEPIRAAKHEREQRRAEQQRIEAERAHALAELIGQAPTMTLEERRAEIRRLQREYDYGVVDAETRAQVEAHPEPGARVGDEAQAGDEAVVAEPDSQAGDETPAGGEPVPEPDEQSGTDAQAGDEPEERPGDEPEVSEEPDTNPEAASDAVAA